jgi:chromosome segregation ATPase
MNHTKKIVAALVLLANGVAASAVAQHPTAEPGDAPFGRDQRNSEAQYDRLLEKKAELQKLSDAIGNEEAKINQAERQLNAQGKQLAERSAALEQNVYSFKQGAMQFRQESQTLDTAEIRLQREGAAIETLRSHVRSNADVQTLNQRIHAYNTQLEQLKRRIVQYNAALRQRQQTADRLKADLRKIHTANVDHGVQTAQLGRWRRDHERLRDNYNVRSRQLKDDFADWRQRRLALESKRQQGGTYKDARGTTPSGHVGFIYNKDAPKNVGSANK